MINFVVALHCEAKPLIQRYKLQKHKQRHAFDIYLNDNIKLIISGVGKIASGAASAYLQAMQTRDSLQYPKSAWLNLGIAGHKYINIGDIVLAHRILDTGNNHIYYPSITFDLPCKSCDVYTGEKVENEYQEAVAYDMEAAGFYSIATHFMTSELIQCIKIISDNETNLADSITAEFTTQLIENNLDTINQVTDSLLCLSNEYQGIYSNPTALQDIIDQIHISVTQQHQLKALLIRWEALSKTPILDVFNLGLYSKGSSKGSHLLSAIETKLNEMSIDFTR